MNGTEKQTEWAKSIRETMIKSMESTAPTAVGGIWDSRDILHFWSTGAVTSTIEDRDARRTEKERRKMIVAGITPEHLQSKVRIAASEKNDAAWWIENRKNPFQSLACEILNAQ